MSDQVAAPAEYGFGNRYNWLVGGAVGGGAGSAIFGAALWAVNPTIVTESIPALYGVDPGAVGWLFHAVHGLVLGVIFGFLVSRRPILGTITADVETDFIARMGPGTRLALAGMVYGLAVWAVLPIIGQTIWIAIGGLEAPPFPGAAVESLLGHLLYGLLLGVLFALLVDIAPTAEDTAAPFEEASEPPT